MIDHIQKYKPTVNCSVKKCSVVAMYNIIISVTSPILCSRAVCVFSHIPLTVHKHLNA